jgi:hypothetical protein
MTLNNRKNVALSIAAGFLFIALIDGWPYGYFTLLRFIVTAVTVYVAYISYEQGRENWTYAFGFIAVLFNPIIPIHLTREIWLPIDLSVATFLLASISFLKLKDN